MFRHKDYAELRDLNEEEPLEIEASKYDLNYIKLDGNIGCMVNGAGLAMATMDIIKLAGGEPANFLDVGGGASQERVEQAFKILLADENVKAVLINIFGGIVRCDMVANGVVAAAKNLGVSIPIVVRLEGTNVEEGRRVLANPASASSPPKGMRDAAEKVVCRQLEFKNVTTKDTKKHEMRSYFPFVLFRVISWLLLPSSDLDIDLSSIQQPHQEQPQQYKADGKHPRCVDRLGNGQIYVLHDPPLRRDRLAVVAGDSVCGDHPCKQAGENK